MPMASFPGRTQGITGLITVPGIINLDFADVKTIMKQAGTAMMGIGTSSGDTRAVDAAQQAISSPLLERLHRWCHACAALHRWFQDLGIQGDRRRRRRCRQRRRPRGEHHLRYRCRRVPGRSVRITVIATGFSDSNVNRQDELFAAQQSQSKAAASTLEPQRSAPAASPAQAAPTRNVRWYRAAQLWQRPVRASRLPEAR